MRIAIGALTLAAMIAAAATPASADAPAPLLLAQAATQPAEPAKKPAAAPKTPAKPPAKPAAKPAAAPKKPAPPNADGITVSDDPASPVIRLDSRLRETVYEMRYTLTTLIVRATGARRHMVAVQITHHDEKPRAYATAERDGAEPLTAMPAQRPSLQCTRNRDKTQACFHDEAYIVELPEDYMATGRVSGLSLRLAAAAVPPMTLLVEAAMIDAQLAATEKAAAKR